VVAGNEAERYGRMTRRRLERARKMWRRRSRWKHFRQ
jgi:hypothetical protein